MESVVNVQGLSVWFGDTRVLEDIDLEFRQGELMVLIGPSGSGKSTLLRAVNRMNELYDGVRTAGEVTIAIDGRAERAYGSGASVARLRRTAGMVFQNPNVLPTSIRQNFSIPLRNVHGLGRNELEACMEEALRDVELWDQVKDRLGAQAQSLSGGQQQRLCFARALALRPGVLLLDEPTASLDFRATNRIEDLIVRLKERYPILAVSHSLGQASRIADTVCVLSAGRIVRTLERSALQDPGSVYRLAEEFF
ncbi:MAG: ATP-binding cassette domain-containing protein [Coriobacteriia bacterium]|nr:ATP-binding cassette domain-containing protein [Coriobacteriia bacterium]